MIEKKIILAHAGNAYDDDDVDYVVGTRRRDPKTGNEPSSKPSNRRPSKQPKQGFLFSFGMCVFFAVFSVFFILF